jgi:L-phenylalanine/L-methionine N-acetyltransferase
MDTAHEANADSIRIRSAEPQDAPAISAHLSESGVFEGLLQVPDVPIASRLEYLQKVDPHACRLVALAGDEVIGAAGLHVAQTTLRRMHTRTLGLSVSPAWQGRGIGRKLLARLLDWSDNWAGVLRVELHVHADNDRALALYRSMGFVEEGRHKAFGLKNGRYVDAFSMARLHPNPPSIAA